MIGQIKVVNISDRNFFNRLADNQSAKNAINFLVSRVRMVEVRSLVIRIESVAECGSVWDGALGEIRHAVHEWSVYLPHAVKVDRCADALSLALNIDDHFVTFTNVQGRAG